MKTPAILQAFEREILPAGARLLQADDPVTVGGHRLAGRLSSSGTGIVYLACGRGTELVTIRTTPVGTTEPGPVRARLRAEAACARRLPATCTAPLLHDGTDATPPYLVSGHVEGPSLERLIDVTGPLTPAMVAALAADLAEVLAAVHGAGVVHGNLTPANVVLTKSGLRMIDFGVAQEIVDSDEPAEIGTVADNPGWLAPELLTGGAPAPACDVYAWGCLVAYAATGHSPYGDGARFQPPDTGGLSGPLRELVDAAVSVDPAARPSATALTNALEALPHADEPKAAEPPAIVPAASAPPRPHRARARAAVSALATLATLLLAVPTATEHSPGPPPRPARPGSPPPSKPQHPTSNAAAMSLYDAPPPVPSRRQAGRSRTPRTVIWMNCGLPDWCSMPVMTGTDHASRSPGWRITWTPSR